MGPLVIAQSQLYGGFFADAEAARSSVNRASQAWNETMLELQSLGLGGPAQHLVVYSRFRHLSLVASSELRYAIDTSRHPFLPDGWGIVADWTEGASSVSEVNTINDPVLALALRHLAALQTADRPASDDDVS